MFLQLNQDFISNIEHVDDTTIIILIIIDSLDIVGT